MNKIDKLKQEIADIENSVDSESTKGDLYDTLVVAYFKAKDIIELYSDVNVVGEVPDTSSEAAEELAKAKATIEGLKGELAAKSTHLQSEAASNTAACLERDALASKIKSIDNILKGK